MKKAPQNEPKKGGLTKAAVVLAAGMMLPNIGEKVTSAENHIQEDDGKKITLMTTNQKQEVRSEGTVVYDPNVYTTPDTSKEGVQSEVTGVEPIPEEEISNSNETPTLSSPSINTEKQPVTETAPPSVELDPQTFTEHVRFLLDSMMGEKTKLEKMQITGIGDFLTIEANITGGGFDIGFTGNLKSSQGELAIDGQKIDANFLIKKTVEKLLKSKLKVVLDQLKNRLENTYKKVNPHGIKNLLIEGGKLKIIFNKNS